MNNITPEQVKRLAEFAGHPCRLIYTPTETYIDFGKSEPLNFENKLDDIALVEAKIRGMGAWERAQYGRFLLKEVRDRPGGWVR